ncbi:MAG TPA: glycosyltransferase family 4 protein [archaeon]|nr:glycosyltransferase family 4 protein [archaeon]
MNVLLLTSTADTRVKAGVETYNQYLKKIFPGLEIIGYETVRPSAFEWFSPLKEPLKANAIGSYVKENIGKLRPGLVITNGMYGWSLTERDTNCPIVNISHGGFVGLALNAIRKTTLEFYRTMIVYSFFEKLSAKNASVVVANSHLTMELNKKYYGVGSTVIHNPVDTKTFAPTGKKKARKKLGLPEGKKIGLFVGRQEYQKGFDLFEKIARMRPEICFISITFPKTRSGMINITGALAKNRKELALYYSAADFVLFPSRFEGFGFVPIEALSCNTPVISSDVGVVKELSIDGLEKVPSLYIEDWLMAIDRVISKKRKVAPSEAIGKRFGFGAFRDEFLALTSRLAKN